MVEAICYFPSFFLFLCFFFFSHAHSWHTNLEERPALVAEQSEGRLCVGEIPQLEPSRPAQLLGAGDPAHGSGHT